MSVHIASKLDYMLFTGPFPSILPKRSVLVTIPMIAPERTRTGKQLNSFASMVAEASSTVSSGLMVMTFLVIIWCAFFLRVFSA